MNKLNLDKIRKDIDKIDNELARLFEERMGIVLDVARYKKENKMPIKDSKREALIIENCKKRIKNPDYVVGFQRVMRDIIDASCDLEEVLLGDAETLTVGYQGVAGAYSHLALQKYFKGKVIEESNFKVFEDVVQAVRGGAIQYGVLPIENSSTGGITEVYDLLRRYDISIVGEKIIKVEHNLIANPGTKIEDIVEVYSHPQGFAQCQDFFKKHPTMKLIPYYNTAKGAELVKQKGTNNVAAVAGVQAAEKYGLEIIAGKINVNENNYTKFVVLAKENKEIVDADKITVVVSLENETGSLYRLLSCFDKFGLNLLNIESRPIAERPWEYFFHIDVIGNLKNEMVIKAFNLIKKEAKEFHVLGNYKADK